MNRFVVVAVLGGLARIAHADDAEPWTFQPGGYVQPQFRLRENSPAAGDEDGFRLARVRLSGTAQGKAGCVDLRAYIEAELQPTFALVDAFATASRVLPGNGNVALDVGQMRVPISRQQLLSDSRLSFIEKAQLATIAPERDLGARFSLTTPHAPVHVYAGMFNGEGRNQVQNINESYLYAGRVEVTPFGGPVPPYQESAFKPFVSIAASAGHNKLTPGEYHEDVTYLGADVAGAWAGLSGSFEYLHVKHDFTGSASRLPGPDYNADGWVAQLAYLLPPLGQSRLEVGARVEEIDRNDTVPISQLGDPNQSRRIYTGVLSAYLKQHLLKAQLAFSHVDEIEDRTSTGANAAYDNDQLLLQITYRVE